MTEHATDATGRQRAALITGAASGIGRATARLFAARGWSIAAADRDTEGLAALLDELGPDRCTVWTLDVTDHAAYGAVIDDVAEATGGTLDLLFNNAGIGVGGFFDEVPLEEHLRVIDVNLIGVVNGIHTALPLLKATENSLCFTTSSSAATYGTPRLASYAATKFAVKGLTEALSVELSRHGVRAADVLPGLIDTAIFSTSPRYVDGQQDDTLAAATENAPAEGPFRLIQPEEVADAVWKSYAGDPRIHWYVPDEVGDIDRAKAESPEAVREFRIAAMNADLEESA